jgi:hypothetical protein
VFFLCSEDVRRPIEATSVGFWMFFLRIEEQQTGNLRARWIFPVWMTESA